MNVAKWHDLREDPNNLPKEYKAVLNQEGKETLYDPNRGFLGLDGVGVIAWCEKPKFTGVTMTAEQRNTLKYYDEIFLK